VARDSDRVTVHDHDGMGITRGETMGSQTAKLAIPYPVGTDRVMDGDNAMQAIADKLDALLAGTASWPGVVGDWVSIAYNPATCTAGQLQYLRRGGVTYVEFQLTGGPGGVPSGQGLLASALPVGFRPAVSCLRLCQGAGVLRGVAMTTGGMLNADFGGTASAAFYGGFCFPNIP